MEGVVEEFVEEKSMFSFFAVSGQYFGVPVSISTHDQVLGGPSGQVFMGCTFPAHQDYRLDIQSAGMAVGKELANRGVIGRFATDFVSIPDENGGFNLCHEVNLRKGGTTHPFLTLRFLTDGAYNSETGEFYSQNDQPKCYFASDTLQSENYRGLLPEDLFDIAIYNNIHFHTAAERGTVFHLLGALSEYGKLGMVVRDNIQQVTFLYNKSKKILDQETAKH